MQTALHWTNSIWILGCSYQFLQKLGSDTGFFCDIKKPKIKIYLTISWGLFFLFPISFFSPLKARGKIKKREGKNTVELQNKQDGKITELFLISWEFASICSSWRRGSLYELARFPIADIWTPGRKDKRKFYSCIILRLHFCDKCKYSLLRKAWKTAEPVNCSFYWLNDKEV